MNVNPSVQKSIFICLVSLLASGCAANLTAPARLAASGEHAEVKVEGQGVVQSDNGDVDCDGASRDACRAAWIDYDRVTMTATPADGWRFAGWRTHKRDASIGREDTRRLGQVGSAYVYEAVFVPVAHNVATR